MQRQPIPFAKTIFICENTRDEGKASCGPHCAGFREQLKAIVKARGLQGRVRIAKAGCLDRCAQGPNIFIYPDNVWYSGVTADDLATIIAEHI